MRKKENRLPSGCSPKQIATRIRAFTRINPFLERPYVGEHVGKFIIKLMPHDYAEAGERVARHGPARMARGQRVHAQRRPRG